MIGERRAFAYTPWRQDANGQSNWYGWWAQPHGHSSVGRVMEWDGHGRLEDHGFVLRAWVALVWPPGRGPEAKEIGIFVGREAACDAVEQWWADYEAEAKCQQESE